MQILRTWVKLCQPSGLHYKNVIVTLGQGQGHQIEGQTHRIYLKLALIHLNTLLMHQWLCLTQLIYVYCKYGPLASF